MTAPISFGSQPFKTSIQQPVVTTMPSYVPANSKIATHMNDMVSITPPIGDFQQIYNVGETPEEQYVKKHIIKNKSVNTKLLVTITPPSFIKVVPSNQFILDTDVSLQISFILNEDDVKQKSLSLTRDFIEKITIKCEPLNPVGLIYVRL